MADIFDEVEEGLREERYKRLLRRYGPAAVAAALAIVLGVAGREAWTAARERAAIASSDAFVAALEQLEAGQVEEARAAFAEAAESGSGAYPALARMQQAAAAAQAGERAEAVRLYEEAAASTSDDFIRAAAQLNAAYLMADEAPLDQLEARLEPLMQPGAPLELLARELLGAAALRAGDYGRARSAYNYLSVAIDAPQGLQRRASQALAAIDAAESSAQNGDE